VVARRNSNTQLTDDRLSRHVRSDSSSIGVVPPSRASKVGIDLTVEFGSDRLACQALLEPPQPLLHRQEQASFMSSDAVAEVLEEIAPAGVRGEETGRTVTMSGCNKFEVVEYENLSIARSTHSCIPSSPNRDDTEAAVTFKRDACRAQRKK
jgi:hypothetical protein